MTKYQIKLSRARGKTKALNAIGLTRRGTPMKLRRWRILDRLGLRGKQRATKYKQLIRAQNIAMGLTTRGTPRLRRRWSGLAGKSRREINTIRQRDWLQRRRYSRGLTARGKSRFSPRELAWRDLRASMDIRRPEFLTDLERAA